MSTTTKILFYEDDGPYACFSNFSDHPFVVNNKTYATSEHCKKNFIFLHMLDFQSKKFEGTTQEETIRTAANAGLSKKLGTTRDFPLRTDWESVKETIMYDALLAKFSQNEDAKKVLLQTGDATIIEDAPHDFVWGIGDGSGANKLGIALMKVRATLSSN